MSQPVSSFSSVIQSRSSFFLIDRIYLPNHIPVFCTLHSSAYQGRERDLIIFSAVRSNRQGRIGFLADWRRMNVALTRAKSGLVVIGDAETLKEGDKHWNAFVHWCEGMGCLVDDSAMQ